jgi:hypothetical protein
VITATPDPFFTVAELKTHMNKTSDGDDAELAGFVAAACSMIVDRIGQVSPVAGFAEVVVARQRRPFRGVAVLPDWPVAQVSAVETLPGGAVLPAADALAGVDGWTLQPGGVLVITGALPCRRVRVTYLAGRDPLPGNIRLAGLELAAHLWKASQLNNSSTRLPAGLGGDQSTMPGVAYALPIRVRELLGLGANPTDQILVG